MQISMRRWKTLKITCDELAFRHTFIWFLNGDSQLPITIKNLIADTSNKCFISIGSIWEIAIKISVHKLELEGTFNQIAGFLNDNDIEVLPITYEHLSRIQLKTPINTCSFLAAYSLGLTNYQMQNNTKVYRSFLPLLLSYQRE